MLVVTTTMSLLIDLGLTRTEERVYLALIDLGIARTGELCSEAKVPKSNIYEILDRLSKKGLVSVRKRNGVKNFFPADPDYLKELYLEKKLALESCLEGLDSFVNQLKKRKNSRESEVTFQYFENISGLKSMWKQMDSSLSSSSEAIYFTAKKSAYQNLVGFYSRHQEIREKMGVRARGLFPEEDRSLGTKRKSKTLKVRFLPLENEAEWGVIDNFVYILYSSSKQPRAFLIVDPIIAVTFRYIFDLLWNLARE